MQLNIRNETDRLKAVVLGQPGSMGKPPVPEETYDAKSYESAVKGIYPAEEAVFREMSAFAQVLQKYDVQVFRPWNIEHCNQVFAREVVYSQIPYNRIFNLPERAHVEGGDVVLYNEMVFVGLYAGADYANLKSARTNLYAFHFLKELFPDKTLIPLELKKHDTDPRQGILHLDCTFMPVSRDKALIYKDGFKHEKDYYLLIDIFGKENLFEITQEEMYQMYTNVFSISPDVVVSEEHFNRLNNHFEKEWGITVERIPYREISKMGGLLRCSTFPLIRTAD
jgi:N-dimethylarginine dimethylaminohydrolase